jgi:hypothetical protein
MLKTVMFTATATALDGTPHGAPVTDTLRAVLSRRDEVLRESYCRHGTSGMYGTGGAASVSAVRPLDAEV